MNNIDNKQKYLEFLDQKEAYENKAKDRLRELFLAVHQVIYPFDHSNIDEKKRSQKQLGLINIHVQNYINYFMAMIINVSMR